MMLRQWTSQVKMSCCLHPSTILSGKQAATTKCLLTSERHNRDHFKLYLTDSMQLIQLFDITRMEESNPDATKLASAHASFISSFFLVSDSLDPLTFRTWEMRPSNERTRMKNSSSPFNSWVRWIQPDQPTEHVHDYFILLLIRCQPPFSASSAFQSQHKSKEFLTVSKSPGEIEAQISGLGAQEHIVPLNSTFEPPVL